MASDEAAARIAALEQEQAQQATFDADIERNVKKKAKELKAQIAAIPEPEKQMQAMTAKCMELMKANERLQSRLDVSEKNGAVTTRQRDKLKFDLSAALEAKKRLEDLSRELQKAKNAANDERREWESKYHHKLEEVERGYRASLDGLAVKINATGAEYDRRARESQLAKSRLLNVMDQFEIRVKHFKAVVDAVRAEKAMVEAERDDARRAGLELQEKYTQALQIVVAVSNSEKKAAQKLAEYTSQSEQFQSLVEQSTGLAKRFQDELAKAQRALHNSEMDRERLKTAAATAEATMVQTALAAEKDKKRLSSVESLCRTMQAKSQEHTMLINRAKTTLHNAVVDGIDITQALVESAFVDA